MSVTEGMKSIVEGIKVAGKERHRFVADVRQETKGLLTRFDRELKEMAADLRKLLETSEKTRLEDFQTIMREIESRLRALRARTAEVQREAQGWIKECHTDQAGARKVWQGFAKKGSAGE